MFHDPGMVIYFIVISIMGTHGIEQHTSKGMFFANDDQCVNYADALQAQGSVVAAVCRMGTVDIT